LKYLATIALLLLPTNLLAAYPYDSVAEVLVESGNHYNGGSATLIAVSGDQALILSCKHVAEEAGRDIEVHWAATGEQSKGKVLLVGEDQDIAMCICPRPKGIRPVPVTSAGVGQYIVNAGFPGLTGTLEWQQGKILTTGVSEMTYTCRPIPGMSGGATFDRYGNQVGVIIAYSLDCGISSAGDDMRSFINHFVQTSDVTWQFPALGKELITCGPASQDVNAPEDFAEFLNFLYDRYVGPDAIPSTSPLLDGKFDECKPEGCRIGVGTTADLSLTVEEAARNRRFFDKRQRSTPYTEGTAPDLGTPEGPPAEELLDDNGKFQFPQPVVPPVAAQEPPPPTQPGGPDNEIDDVLGAITRLFNGSGDFQDIMKLVIFGFALFGGGKTLGSDGFFKIILGLFSGKASFRTILEERLEPVENPRRRRRR